MKKSVMKLTALMTAAALTLSAAPRVMAEEAKYDLSEYVERVNDYWISAHKSPPGYGWEDAAYFTGNMEAYFLTGIEEYRDYAERWAQKNNWMGHAASSDSVWNNSNVYHADNQTCFQTYIDLYNLDMAGLGDGEPETKIARAKEVAERQMGEGTNSFWWWCDALYMAMPYYTKLYTATGDGRYLDAMYDYFIYAKKLLYDGEGGIAQNGERVNLFYRDKGYIGSTYLGEKNIWARGTGWVMAALAKTLGDVPEDWEHYGDIKKVFLEMSESCKKYAKTDEDGRKYFTQSVLPMYPVSAENPQGYETSGTAFITYALFWGINAGILPKDEYLPTAEGCLRYLTEVAITDAGRVGYIQPVGASAGGATTLASTYNFGVGGTLLALCEAQRLYNGAGDDPYPYLVKKTVGAAAVKIGSGNIFSNGRVRAFDGEAYISDSHAMLPLRALADAFGAEISWDEGEKKAALTINGARGESFTAEFTAGRSDFTVGGAEFVGGAAAEIKDGRLYVPLRSAAKAFDRRVYWNDGEKIAVLGRREAAFYDCDAGAVKLLSSILESGSLPERPDHGARDFTLNIPEFKDPNRIKIVAATAQHVPQPENGIFNAFDDDTETRWAVDGAADEGIFELGSNVYIEKIALSFWQYDVRQTRFELLVSEDGENYENYFNGLSEQGPMFTYINIGRKARYIKVIGHGNTQSGVWTSLLEIIPFGA